MKIDDLTEEQLVRVITRRYSFQEDEVKVLFPTVDKMREALKTFESVSKNEDDTFMWDSEDSSDLSDSQRQQVHNYREDQKERKKRAEAAKDKLNIKATGAELKPEELSSTRDAIRQILEETYDEDIEE